MAGLVSTVTRSGTNQFSGELLEYFRDTSLNAITRDQEAVGLGKPDYRRNQWGIGIGGPIIRDRAHFYGAIEFLTENKSFTVNSGVPQFYSALHGTFPTDYLRRKYFIRGDVQLTQQQSFFMRYALDKERIDCEACGGTNAAFFDSFVESPRDTLVTGHTWVISSRTLNDLRVQWPARLRHATGPPGTSKWDQPGEFPAERFEGFTPVYNFPSFHWGSNAQSLNWTNRFEIKEDFSHVRGQHQFKFGGEYAQYISPEDVTANRGTWTFGAGPVLRRVSGGDCQPEEPDFLHRVVSRYDAEDAELLDQLVRPGRMEAAEQPHAEFRRPARHPVPLVQQPARPDGPRESAAVHRS